MYVAQNKEGLKEVISPVKPAYGVIILQDKIVEDPNSLIITELRSDKDRFTTYNDHILSGTVVEISENFIKDLVGVDIKIGDRIMTTVNKSVPVSSSSNHKFLIVRETEITAIIDPDEVYEVEY